MITKRTIQRIVVFIRPARPFVGLLFFPYLIIVSSYYRGPDEITILLRLQWYLYFVIGAIFLFSITIGHTVKTLLMSGGIALLALASLFNTRWLWLAGSILIVIVLFLEELPSIRKNFASYRETYRKISKASDT
jgi:hypothetical protein